MEGTRARASVGTLRPDLACFLFLYCLWALLEQVILASCKDHAGYHLLPRLLTVFPVPASSNWQPCTAAAEGPFWLAPTHWGLHCWQQWWYSTGVTGAEKENDPRCYIPLVRALLLRMCHPIASEHKVCPPSETNRQTRWGKEGVFSLAIRVPISYPRFCLLSQSLKYLLFNHLQKKFANPSF